MERYEHEWDFAAHIGRRKCRHCGFSDEADQADRECDVRLRLALDAALAERDALREEKLQAEKDLAAVGFNADAWMKKLRAERDALLVENNGLAFECDRAKRDRDKAEARAERAEAFVRAYLGLDGNEDVDDEALNERARALLAPEAQR